MSKISLLLTVPALLGMGALAVWNVSLQSELDELRADARTAAESASSADADEVRDEPRPVVNERAMTRIKVLESRLEQVEQRTAPAARAAEAAPEAVAAAEGEAVATDEAAALSGPESAFRARVYAAMDEREAERRRERREREAQRMAQRMLRGIEVTDAQAAQVAAALLDHATQRDALRGDEDLDAEVRRSRFEELMTARNTTLAGILGEDVFGQVQQRVQARDDGRRRGGRTPNGGRRRAPDESE